MMFMPGGTSRTVTRRQLHAEQRHSGRILAAGPVDGRRCSPTPAARAMVFAMSADAARAAATAPPQPGARIRAVARHRRAATTSPAWCVTGTRGAQGDRPAGLRRRRRSRKGSPASASAPHRSTPTASDARLRRCRGQGERHLRDRRPDGRPRLPRRTRRRRAGSSSASRFNGDDVTDTRHRVQAGRRRRRGSRSS